jgi:hypothetical protein
MVIRHCRLLSAPRRADLRDTFSTGFTSQCESATSSRPCKGSKPWTCDIRDRWAIIEIDVERLRHLLWNGYHDETHRLLASIVGMASNFVLLNGPTAAPKAWRWFCREF